MKHGDRIVSITLYLVQWVKLTLALYFRAFHYHGKAASCLLMLDNEAEIQFHYRCFTPSVKAIECGLKVSSTFIQ